MTETLELKLNMNESNSTKNLPKGNFRDYASGFVKGIPFIPNLLVKE